MRLVSDPVHDEVDLAGTATELASLASAVAEGAGFIAAASGPSPDDTALAGIEVEDAGGPGVHIGLDDRRRILVISGDAAARAVLADNLQAMAESEDGGHLHVDYFPDHPYLLEGSVPLVVKSPHGGMPRRRPAG